MNVFEKCPVLENDIYQIRLIEEADAGDLLKVYGQKQTLPFFNSDNCHGSNFYCANLEDMKSTIHYWLIEYYDYKGFVRFSIVDKRKNQVIGTLEMFRREAADFFNDCGILRLDLRSDYEKREDIQSIISLVIPPFFDLFSCSKIATKAPVFAIERMEALKELKFTKSEEVLIGGDGKQYYDYWLI